MIDIINVYKKLSRLPLGRRLAGKLVTGKAPYFSTINPIITDLEPGTCTIEMKDRRSIHNHLGTIHAIAMCNLCELTMGMALHPSMPENLRWIAKGMRVRYLKKATGTLKGTCTVDVHNLKPGDMNIPISIKDAEGDTVVDATITVYISTRKTKDN
jgi:acyl-coenzyme A thioesterase PaaI-like protein